MVRVLPERRRGGIGTALIEAAASEARELGHESAWGYVQAGDEDRWRSSPRVASRKWDAKSS